MANPIVYVIDDEPLIARIAQVNLEHAGYTVESAHDGLAAWEALESGKICPGLILLDITLPYMDGFEVLRRLKANSSLAHIPVIIMSARALDQHIFIAQEIGAARYMNKPINPGELIKTVAQVLAETRDADAEPAEGDH